MRDIFVHQICGFRLDSAPFALEEIGVLSVYFQSLKTGTLNTNAYCGQIFAETGGDCDRRGLRDLCLSTDGCTGIC